MSHHEHSSEGAQINPFYLVWAQAVVRWRWVALALSLIVTLSSALLVAPSEKLPPTVSALRHDILGNSGLIIDTSVEAFNDPTARSSEVLTSYRDLFGRDDYFMVLIEGDVFTLPYLSKLDKLHRELEALDIDLESLGVRRDQNKASITKSGAGSENNAEATDSDDFADFEGLDDLEGSEEGGSDSGTVIEQINSLINARRVHGSSEGIQVDEWFDPLPTAEALPELKRLVLNEDTLVGQVVGKSGEHSLILLRAQFMSEDDSIKVNSAIAEIAKRYDGPGFKVHIGGMPQLNATLKVTLLSTLKVLLMISILLMIGMLSYQFRHLIAVVPPLIVVMMAALNTFAIMSIFGMPVTMLSNILPAFIICVGIGDSVHLLSVYRDQFKLHRDSKRAVIEAVAMTGTPILFTSLTTMVGLLSFRFASIPAIQDMGTAGAIGVGAACLHSLIFLPALLTFNQKSGLGLSLDDEISDEGSSEGSSEGLAQESAQEPPREERDWIDRFIDYISDSQAGLNADGSARPESSSERRRRHITLIVAGALTIIALIGVTQLRVWHNPLAWLPEGEPTVETFDIVDREVGGSANIQLLITGGPNGMRDAQLLNSIEELKRYIMAYRHPDHGELIGNVTNVNDILKEMRRAFSDGDEAAYKLPETREEISQFFELFSNMNRDELSRLATLDLSASQMTLRLKWLEATSYRELTDYVEAGIKMHIPEYASVEPTGAVYTLVSTVGTLLFDLVRSFGTALLVITLIMILMLKGLKLGLISMLPNLIPIIWLMGMMGFTGITIDMNNILIASIAIGLAVDDTIHLLHHFRVHYDESADSFSAINASLKHAGRAMVVTSSILTLGFFAYLAADMKNIQVFGLLIGLCAFLAMLIDLIVGPALLRTLYPRQST